MALYKATVKANILKPGIRLEKGMSVDLPSQGNPLGTNGGKDLNDAFHRKYGIDLKKAGLLNAGIIDVVKMG